MKFIVSLLLTALLSFVSGLYLPWWGIAIAAFLVAVVIPLKSGISFVAGFAGVFLLWGGLAWWIDSANNSILSQKIAQVLPLGGSVIALILVTAFVGALVAGFAALAGSYVRKPVVEVEE
jgi:hypothetical protein